MESLSHEDEVEECSGAVEAGGRSQGGTGCQVSGFAAVALGDSEEVALEEGRYLAPPYNLQVYFEVGIPTHAPVLLLRPVFHNSARLVLGAEVGAGEVGVDDVGEEELAGGAHFELVIHMRVGLLRSDEYFHCFFVVERVIALLVARDELAVHAVPEDVEELFIMAYQRAGGIIRLSRHRVKEPDIVILLASAGLDLEADSYAHNQAEERQLCKHCQYIMPKTKKGRIGKVRGAEQAESGTGGGA